MRVPDRHYSAIPEKAALEGVSVAGKVVLSAIYTRSADGYVRQSALDSLISARTSWAPGFILPLLGEYVVQINRDISYAVKVGRLSPQEWEPFVAENSELVNLTRARAISYLDAYGSSWVQMAGEHAAVSAFEAMDGLGCIEDANDVEALARWRSRLRLD